MLIYYIIYKRNKGASSWAIIVSCISIIISYFPSLSTNIAIML
jgi:hypothetical protein